MARRKRPVKKIVPKIHWRPVNVACVPEFCPDVPGFGLKRPGDSQLGRLGQKKVPFWDNFFGPGPCPCQRLCFVSCPLILDPLFQSKLRGTLNGTLVNVGHGQFLGNETYCADQIGRPGRSSIHLFFSFVFKSYPPFVYLPFGVSHCNVPKRFYPNCPK